jgi:hypothetical protein
MTGMSKKVARSTCRFEREIHRTIGGNTTSVECSARPSHCGEIFLATDETRIEHGFFAGRPRDSSLIRGPFRVSSAAEKFLQNIVAISTIAMSSFARA